MAEKQLKLAQELQTILEMTNSVPFKVKTGKLYCAFCYLNGDPFDNINALRIHTFEEHDRDKAAAVEGMLRPPWQNEILRIDVKNLICNVCDIKMKGWNEMFQHMYDKHDKEFDEAYTRLIPFKLSIDFVHCALCDERHENLPTLDAHMNAHYNNHVCPECGDTFVALVRLKKHSTIHNVGKFPCKYCGKIFSLEVYRTKHTAMMHENAKPYKCVYCPERFSTDYVKHLHTKEYHKEKIVIFNCEQCGKTFDWRPYYMAHLRKIHRKLKRYQCTYCLKWFGEHHDYKLHVQRHTGTGEHVCTICSKNFVRPHELRVHMKAQHKEN